MKARLCILFFLMLALSVGLLPGISPAPERASGAQFARVGPSPHLLSDAPWGGNVRVNADAETASQEWPPSIAVDPSGNAYAVWTDWRNEAYSDIYFSYRPAGGAWGTNVRVDDDEGTAYQAGPSIAVDPSGNAYAVWTDWRNGISNPDIYFAYRPAGGSWGTDVRVNDDTGTASQFNPCVAVDPGGNAYAVWTDTRNGGSDPDIYSSYRPAAGSWGTNGRVDDDPGTAAQYGPSIAVDPSGNAYAVWSDNRNGNADIYFSYRPAGDSWGTNVRVDDDEGTADQTGPSIAVDPSSNAYTVWHDNRNGNYDVYFSYRPAGDSWGTNVRVDDDPGTAPSWWTPSIAVDPTGNACAVWQDDRNGYGNYDVYFSYRPAAGSWGTNLRVNDDAGTADQYNASIAVDPSGNAYAVWTDMRTGGTGYPSGADIYFSNWWAFKVYLPLILRNHQ